MSGEGGPGESTGVRDSGNQWPRRTEKVGSPEVGKTSITRESWQGEE